MGNTFATKVLEIPDRIWLDGRDARPREDPRWGKNGAIWKIEASKKWSSLGRELGCCFRSTHHKNLGCVGLSVGYWGNCMGQSVKSSLVQTELEHPVLATTIFHEGLLN